MIEPTTMVQYRPAKESAMRAPNNGVKLPAPLKYEMVLEALTSGMFSSFVRYVIMFDLQPMDANMSHTSLAAKFYTISHS